MLEQNNLGMPESMLYCFRNVTICTVGLDEGGWYSIYYLDKIIWDVWKYVILFYDIYDCVNEDMIDNLCDILWMWKVCWTVGMW